MYISILYIYIYFILIIFISFLLFITYLQYIKTLIFFIICTYLYSIIKEKLIPDALLYSIKIYDNKY